MKIQVSKLEAVGVAEIVLVMPTPIPRTTASATARDTERRFACSASLNLAQWAKAGMKVFLISQKPA